MTDSGNGVIGRVIDGRYEILERIGEGGTGVVYRAKQRSIDRVVAIKMLNRELTNVPSWVQRFYNEAKACSQLQHPNTIRMFDFGQSEEGNLYMTMEYLPGRSLRKAIADEAPMAPIRVLKILVQCCGSLSEAHAYGIIHRDIKPDNVFVLDLAGSPDHVKLLDFSVAKLMQDTAGLRTQAGVVFGTPQYMSPEQGRGRRLDPRSDLYALGVLGYEMLSGKVPFDDENPLTVLQMHVKQPPPPLPLSVPPEARQIIETALAKDPAQRFQTATEMLERCQAAFQRIAGHTPPPVLSGSPHGNAPGALPPGAPTAPPVMPPTGGAAPPPAGPPPAGPPPAGPPPAGPPPASTGHQAKTMIAGAGGPPSPAAQKTMIAGGPQGSGPPPAGPPPGVGRAAEKTMLADPSQLAGGSSHGPPGPPGPPAGPPPGPPNPPGPPGGGQVKKTMMLQDSEGVISYAQGAPSPAPAASQGYPPYPQQGAADSSEGPSVLFWVLCLLTGLAVGVGAYWLVLGLGG